MGASEADVLPLLHVMELQPKDKEHHPPRTSPSTPLPATADTLPPTFRIKQPVISTSVPALRFPKPQGSRHLANWLSSSSPDLLQLPTMSDTSSLADSAYEIINGIDNEDHEAALTESTSSLEVPRPEDVHSLDGSDGHYDTDTDEESDASSHASSIRYADQVLQTPSSILPNNNQTIEFREAKTGLQGFCRGQHVLREFSEDETAAIAKDWGMRVWDTMKPPKRLNASISLDMSEGAFSIQEPLRVFYVGPSEPKRDIILKLGSACWASPRNGARDDVTFGRHREGVYNVVPISSFGSTPELDLMEASQYQIKVEHCTSISAKQATEPSEDKLEKKYSLTIGHDAHYEVSISRPNRPSAYPTWALPHVAIFFIAEDDNEEDRQVRELAAEMINEMRVSSIFISDSQSFVKPAGNWVNLVHPNGPHISLDSLDPEESVTPVRIPIDFTSFTNIEPRQMNRNLAQLTGLIEPLEGSAASKVEADAKKQDHDKEEGLDWFDFCVQGVKMVEDHPWSFAAGLVSVIMSLLWTFLAVSSPGTSVLNPVSPLSGVVGIQSSTPPVVTVTSTSLKAHTSTTTVVINVTSTKTVELGRTQPSTSTLASALSFAGLLSDKPSVAPVEPPAKKTICAAHIYGPKEILVTLPSATKEWWLSKGAIDINVWRSEVPLQVRLSSVDEGILVNLGQNEGYGAFNVTVVTTRKPKINETFLVDFGRPMYVEAVSAGFQALFDIAKVVSSTTNEAVQMVEDTCAPGVAKLRGEATSLKEHMAEARKVAQGCYEESINRVKRSIVPDDMTKLLKDTKDQVARQLKAAKELREGLDISILQAQIASRLWWLKVQGKKDEYDEYERNATRLLKAKFSLKGNDQSAKGSSKDSTCNGIFGKRRCKQQLKRSASPRDATKESRWKKKIMG